MQVTLQQTVMAKDLQSAHLPGRRQTRSAMFFIFHKRGFLRRQLLKHAGHGSCADSEVLRDRTAGHPVVFRAALFQNGLQIVVDRLRGIGPMCSRYH